MNRALTLLTIVCGLAIALPARAPPVKTTGKTTMSSMQKSTTARTHHKRAHHKTAVKHMVKKTGSSKK